MMMSAARINRTSIDARASFHYTALYRLCGLMAVKAGFERDEISLLPHHQKAGDKIGSTAPIGKRIRSQPENVCVASRDD